MRRRWRESDWGRARRQQRNTGSTSKWVGSSFDVGVFLGVNILDERIDAASREGLTPPATSPQSPLPEISVASATPSAVAETFVTAHSHLSTPANEVPGPSTLTPNSSRDVDCIKPPSPSSSTALLAPTMPQTDQEPQRLQPAEGQTSNVAIPPSSVARPNGHATLPPSKVSEQRKRGKGKGKDVHVHYEEPPAPPSEVLARRGSAVEETSAGASEQATAENQVKWGDVILRDRMLVRVSYTEDGVSPTFDESQNRVTRHLETEGWVEYIVAWRRDRLELYADHHTPGREWLTGHKKLVYVVPLGDPATKLSLYSFVDLTFCLTCPPTRLKLDSSKRQRHFFGGSRGTNIFVFKVKCRSRAIDWTWQLWRHLGGQLPPYIDIRSPALDTRVSIDVPGHDTADLEAAYSVFTRDNILGLCEKYLRTVPEFRTLMEREHAEGATFELAWRFDTNLDWVWRASDVMDKERKWSVLCGLALSQAGRSAHLEFRRKRHVPTRLHMRDGTRLDEPPAVEGFLDRIRPNSQLKQSLYLVTHDGYLFALNPARAHPPPTPGAPEPASVFLGSDSGSSETRHGDTRGRAEVRRGQLQILEATGVSDLRSIVAVRRAFQLVPRQMVRVDVQQAADWEDSEDFWAHSERCESDDEDAGGEAGLANARDKTQLRMRRSFELVLTSGRVIRFEAYSCATALEWIVRLRPLISYWKKRHQYDARLEMDIAHLSTGRPRITPQHMKDDHEHEHGHGHRHDTTAVVQSNGDAALPDLDHFYNWCVLDGCRPILKCGRLYGRKGWWGQYKHVQLVLISGHLVQFHITGHTSLHHRRDKVIPLLDAYICSGYFAAQYLPDGQYDANAPAVARRYQDGLETDDSEEDTLFVIWYRVPKGLSAGVRRNNAGADIPPLTAKRKVAVFRTRSKLERDAWVWAINAELEKVVRASRTREEAVRSAGELIAK
ncbi:Pleckstrin homology domain-containing protein [Cubamyces menziesii]|nr:Pleckstrin homology domain-containing protein [Cubamyces menziesii]